MSISAVVKSCQWITVVLAAVCLGAWSGAWLAPAEPWWLRAAVGGVGLAALAGVALLPCWRARRDRRTLERYIEAFCRLNPRHAHDAAEQLPPLPDDHPLAAETGRLVQLFLNQYRRVQELEHQRAALELRWRRAESNAQRIHTIFDQLAEPVLVIDRYEELVLVNRRAAELFGVDQSRLPAPVDEVIECQKLVEVLTATARHRVTAARTTDVEIKAPEGQSRTFRATVSRLETVCDPEGGEEAKLPDGVVAVLRDIADQKALQKRHAEFVSAVSHEMKTPLAGIKAYVELLADGDVEDEETREEFLKVINGQADRLQRLVENMLNLARIEAGVVRVNKQPQSLNELLEEALRVVQPAAEAKDIELIADLSPLYLSVLADRDMLLQAAINLLSNAVKYTPEGGRVTLRSRLADREVRFEVEDTGVGLSPEDCQRVFERFYRVKKDKDMASGTGLGLPLAKHIVEDVHGGRLTLESQLGKGSTFAVTLPCAAQMQCMAR